jgi:centriolar protein POC1
LIKAHNARIRSIGFSCDGLLLSTCGDDKLVKIWSTVDRRLQYTLKKHENWVRYCEFSPTATNIVSCDDKKIIIWDLNTKKPIQTYQEHNGVIHQAKFHSLGNCMASCSHDKKIKIYDLRSQHVIQIYEGH